MSEPNVYPDIIAKSGPIRARSSLNVEESDAGIIRSQDPTARQLYDIDIEHPLILCADVTTLQTFWADNKNARIITQRLADGHNYNCLLTQQPQPEDVNAIRKTVRQKLTGARCYTVQSIARNSDFDGDVSALNPKPVGGAFSNDGLKMFVLDRANVHLEEWDLSTAYRPSTATHSNNLVLSGQDTAPEDFVFNEDGTVLLMIGDTGNSIYEYSWSTGFDSTTSAFVDSVSIGAKETDPRAIGASSDGKEVYFSGLGNSIHQLDLGTGFDISTSNDNNKSFDAGVDVSGLRMNPTNTKIFLTSTEDDTVKELGLDTARSITTASIDISKDISATDTTPAGFFFGDGGLVLCICGDDANKIFYFDVGR